MSESDKQQQEILNIKRFGYIISALLIIVSNISLIDQWPVAPLLFLITMYFLTGALWIPGLIKPFYKLFVKNQGEDSDEDGDGKNPQDFFKEN
jgi:hypothetical protein